MRHLLAAALLAAFCTSQQAPSPAPVPEPGPVEIPDGGDDASAPVNDPQTQCEVAWSVAADDECPPSMGHDAWLAKCVKYSQDEIDCVVAAESCLALRSCKGFQ